MPIEYKHICGLKFNFMEMREPKQNDEGEIVVIVLWLPNCRETPMMIVDWSFADVPDKSLFELCDRWVARQSTAMIETLIECQDAIEEYTPSAACPYGTDVFGNRPCDLGEPCDHLC